MQNNDLPTEQDFHQEPRFELLRWTIRAAFLLILALMIGALMKDPQMSAKMQTSVDDLMESMSHLTATGADESGN